MYYVNARSVLHTFVSGGAFPSENTSYTQEFLTLSKLKMKGVLVAFILQDINHNNPGHISEKCVPKEIKECKISCSAQRLKHKYGLELKKFGFILLNTHHWRINHANSPTIIKVSMPSASVHVHPNFMGGEYLTVNCRLREHLCSRLCNWKNKSLNQLYLLQKHTSLHKTNQYYKFCLTIPLRQDEEYLSGIFTPQKLSKSIMQPQSETHRAAQKRRRLILVKANVMQCGIYKVRYYIKTRVKYQTVSLTCKFHYSKFHRSGDFLWLDHYAIAIFDSIRQH
ncbi:hypothetical protein EGR_07870 [Echinococcus granulosus]|uniref:Uncharacterized protein n=1 Tax=Echinococcus granulosus TaxID=6210 RepID=W6U7W0_ECHGR|nr:hypothetical protein EGR_07870 [Echinococcus granulosus]EUB57260.1 hypothetical protein EGR_07870 [Echinococcus granulosus]